MRYIPIEETTPDQEWIDTANALMQEMRTAPDDDARKKIIDDNKTEWGKLKDWLLELSHQKCWFSEAKDCFSHWDVEHYRPKMSAKDIDGTKHVGYWFLAFDWTNYRICGNVGNRKKGTFFPLRDGCERVGDGGDIRLEEPLLLDPADPDDPSLLYFNSIGNAIQSPAVANDWETKRVEYSIERYKLNEFQALVDKRKLLWNECWTLIKDYLGNLRTYEDTQSPIARQTFKDKAQQIRSKLQPDKEFSSVARACIESSGDPRVIGLARTV